MGRRGCDSRRSTSRRVRSGEPLEADEQVDGHRAQKAGREQVQTPIHSVFALGPPVVGAVHRRLERLDPERVALKAVVHHRLGLGGVHHGRVELDGAAGPGMEREGVVEGLEHGAKHATGKHRGGAAAKIERVELEAPGGGTEHRDRRQHARQPFLEGVGGGRLEAGRSCRTSRWTCRRARVRRGGWSRSAVPGCLAPPPPTARRARARSSVAADRVCRRPATVCRWLKRCRHGHAGRRAACVHRRPAGMESWGWWASPGLYRGAVPRDVRNCARKRADGPRCGRLPGRAEPAQMAPDWSKRDTKSQSLPLVPASSSSNQTCSPSITRWCSTSVPASPPM